MPGTVPTVSSAILWISKPLVGPPQVDARVGLDALGRVPGPAEDQRQRHREAGGVGGRDQLLGVGALAVAEARRRRVGALERLRAGVDRRPGRSRCLPSTSRGPSLPFRSPLLVAVGAPASQVARVRPRRSRSRADAWPDPAPPAILGRMAEQPPGGRSRGPRPPDRARSAGARPSRTVRGRPLRGGAPRLPAGAGARPGDRRGHQPAADRRSPPTSSCATPTARSPARCGAPTGTG